MVYVNNAKMDAYELRNMLVQGEKNADTIVFKLPPEMSGYTWHVRGTINGGSVQSAAITPTETTADVSVSWVVGDVFTAVAGVMHLTLVGTNTNGTISKAVGTVEILPDMSMSAAPVVTQNLYEQLVAQAGLRAEDAEAYAVGTRGGVAVGSSDPAYHNNAKYYTEHSATVSVGTVSSVTGTPTVTNSGTPQAAVLNFGIPKGDAATVSVGTVETLPAGSSAYVTNSGTSSAAVFDFGIPQGQGGGSSAGMIADPTTKSAGQYLKYDGSDWVADSVPASFNKTRLWYNSNTGSSATYAAQTQPINGSGYSAYLVVFRQVANGGAYASFVYPVGGSFALAAISLGWGNTVQYKRTITSASETGIVFSGGKKCNNGATSNTDDNSAMIPAYVFGIR